MRAGLVISGGLDIISGGFLYDRMLVEYLRGQGDEVEFISLPWRSYTRNLLDNFCPQLLHRLAKSPVDVLLQDELCHPSLVWLNRRYRRTYPHTPIVAIVHHLRGSEARPAWHNKLFGMVGRRYKRDHLGKGKHPLGIRLFAERVSVPALILVTEHEHGVGKAAGLRYAVSCRLRPVFRGENLGALLKGFRDQVLKTEVSGSCTRRERARAISRDRVHRRSAAFLFPDPLFCTTPP